MSKAEQSRCLHGPRRRSALQLRSRQERSNSLVFTERSEVKIQRRDLSAFFLMYRPRKKWHFKRIFFGHFSFKQVKNQVYATLPRGNEKWSKK